MGGTGGGSMVEKSSTETGPANCAPRPTPMFPPVPVNALVAVIAFVAALCHVPCALRYCPVSCRTTCTTTELPVGISEIRAQLPEKYADDGDATEPSV